MMHIIYFKVLLQGHWRGCSSFSKGLSIIQGTRLCPGQRQAETASHCTRCSQMETAWNIDLEVSNFANAYKNCWRDILIHLFVYFFNIFVCARSRSFSYLLAAPFDADFSICRFVKHHGMFWFSIKNILPKWFQSPTPENKRTSSLSPSSVCSDVQ